MSERKTKPLYKNFPSFPKDPRLRRRVVNMARRGFDVPPSKQEDFETYRRKGFKLDEIKAVLALE